MASDFAIKSGSKLLAGWPSLLAGLLVAYSLIGGVISLLGWPLDAPRLTDWVGNGISIQPNAALAVVLASIAVLLIRSGFTRVPMLLGVFVAALGVTALLQIVTEIDLRINTLLMFDREWGRLGVITPGQMNAPGASSWTLIGIAIFLLSITRSDKGAIQSTKTHTAAAGLAIITGAVAGLSIFGYAIGAQSLTTRPRLTVIALQTASYILAVALALILQTGNAGPMRLLNANTTTGQMLRRFVPAIVVFPVLLGVLQHAGEAFGLYDPAFGIAAATVAEILLLLALLWWTGSATAVSEARKTAMFENALDCIVSMDHLGMVKEFNPAAEATFGYRREDVLGKELAELIIPPEMRDAHRRGLAGYLSTGEGPVIDNRLELTAVRSDGSELPVELSVTRIQTGGMPEFTAYLRDITVRKQAERAMQAARDALEQRVEERTAELNLVNQALKRSNQELEQFASVASHDLQEPLRKIQTFGDRLGTKFGDQLGEQGRAYVDRMNASATRMRSLIDSLLNFSRITTKAQAFAPTDLNSVLTEVTSDLEGRLHTTGGRVRSGTLPTIDADRLQMYQLLQNLVGNGLKFHRPDEKPLVTVESRILNSGDGHPERCEILVEDNGIGFEETYLDRIFEVFQRLHGRQEFEGTGMGLAICRKIAERHDGTITASSKPGRGSIFTVTLPVVQSPPDITK
ncbi:MAG: ATP-binding protein [Pyrinomonadaceae bacterium]